MRNSRAKIRKTYRAPRFSNLSLRVIDLATVTPSGHKEMSTLKEKERKK
jgi:hypothetical protein